MATAQSGGLWLREPGRRRLLTRPPANGPTEFRLGSHRYGALRGDDDDTRGAAICAEVAEAPGVQWSHFIS